MNAAGWSVKRHTLITFRFMSLSSSMWFDVFVVQLHLCILWKYGAGCQSTCSRSLSWNWSRHSAIVLYVSIRHNFAASSGDISQVCLCFINIM